MSVTTFLSIGWFITFVWAVLIGFLSCLATLDFLADPFNDRGTVEWLALALCWFVAAAVAMIPVFVVGLLAHAVGG